MSWEALFARRTAGVRLGVEHIVPVWEELGRPSDGRTVVHVVGTNGKGSAAALTAHALRRRGRSVGLYTSPHLLRVGERVRVDGEAVADGRLEHAVERVLGVEGRIHSGRALSFFEVLTLAGLLVFEDAQVDVVILEAGLGGRLDATRIVPPTVTGVTRIARDHEQWLGEGLTAIAREKAAVLRAGVPAVSAPQSDEAREVLLEVAARVGTSLTWAPRLDRAPRGLTGEHQRENGGVALAMAQIIEPSARAADLDGVRWPGRLEHIGCQGGTLILDVAHNPDGIAALCRHLLADGGSKPERVVVGCMPDKDGAAMLRTLSSVDAEPWLVPPPAAGAPSSSALRALWLRGRVFQDVDQLWAPLRALLQTGATACVCGSHYLVGAVRGWALDGVASTPDPGDPLRSA